MLCDVGKSLKNRDSHGMSSQNELQHVLLKLWIIESRRNCNNKSRVLLLCYYMKLYVALTVLVSGRVTATSIVSPRTFVSLKSHLETITFTQTSPAGIWLKWLCLHHLWLWDLITARQHTWLWNTDLEGQARFQLQIHQIRIYLFIFLFNQSSLIIFLFSPRYYCTKRFWCH